MKHSSSRELFAYWDRQRGNRAAPERVDIEPAAIRRVLGDTFILGADVGIEHRFRLAGTRVCALFGRELKNEPFVTLFEQPHQSSVRELVAIVAEETVGVIAGIHGRTTEGFATELELLLLPLCHRGNINQRMVGILAPSEVPFWPHRPFDRDRRCAPVRGNRTAGATAPRLCGLRRWPFLKAPLP